MKPNRFRFKLLLLVICFVLLLPAMRHMPAAAAGGDGVTTFRALLVGNAEYDGGQNLRAPIHDTVHMEQLLLQQDFEGVRFAPENIIKLTDATKLQTLEAIRTQLAREADGDDVTYFYYSGHGTYDGAKAYLVGVELALLSVEELKTALDAVPGRKVVLLDCCYSGGFAGKASGGQAPGRPPLKNAGAPVAPQAEADACRQFQEAAMLPFAGQSGAVRRSLTTSSYKVLAATSPFQYSYEYRFNAPGSGYGPLFRMNGQDWAGGSGNWSGEFTGMLVAGAGRVSFSGEYPEIRALADTDRDRCVTLDELYRYLRGAVLYSAVQVYPEGDQTALFRHSEAEAPDWSLPLLIENNGGPLAPAQDDPVRFSLTGGAWPDGVTVRRARFIGDNRDADNADAVIESVAEVTADSPVPDGAEATLFWDGNRQDGEPAGDGWYFARLTGGNNAYPPVPFELRRGVSNFPGASPLPANQTVTANPQAGEAVWYAYTPGSDGLLLVESAAGGPAAEAELCDAGGNTLAWFGDPEATGLRLARVLKAGQQVFVGVRAGAPVAVNCRYVTPSACNKAVSADTSRVSYTLFRPDTTGLWTVRAEAAYDDDSHGIALYDARMKPVAWGERYARSYRYLCAELEAGRLYVLETPKLPVPMTVAAWGPGRQPLADTAAMPVLTTAACAVRIAKSHETRFFRFTPTSSTGYRFYSTAPLEGSAKVDSYAFLTDARGVVIASDDDVDYNSGQVQFDFSARLTAGTTYVLAVRAYVQPGQVSSLNPNLDFTVTVRAWGASAQTQAVSKAVASGKSVIALYDDDGDPGNGIGPGGRLTGWGASQDAEHDGYTGLDFGEGIAWLRRWGPQPLYAPGGALFTDVWAVGGAYAARDMAGAVYAWGIGAEDANFGVIRRLDNPVNGLAKYDITAMAQGARQNDLFFLDGRTGRIHRMQGLAGTPEEVPAPGLAFARIASSEGSLLALDDSGSLWATGLNRYGECGSGSTDVAPALVRVPLPKAVADFAAGENHALALASDGTLYAWGRNDYGNLGLGSAERLYSSPVPVPLAGMLEDGETVVRVFAGGNSSAALTTDGRLLVWGGNDYGQLGIGDTFGRASPTEAAALRPGALGSGKAVASVVFGPESAYALLTDGSLYVAGRNDCGQLGFQSPAKTAFTKLCEPDLRSTNNRLLDLSLSAGELSPPFSPETFEYAVTMPYGVALSNVQAVKADTAASVSIDGEPAASKLINAGPGPARVVVEVTAQNGDRQAYAVNFPHSPSANADLASLTVSGGYLSAPLNGTDSQYAVVIPETAAGAVTLKPVTADPNATVTVDGEPDRTSRAVSLSGGQTSEVRVEVTAQLGNKRAYLFTVARKPLLAAFSTAPVYSYYGSIAPGGTNRLAFRYTLNCPATVKIELKKGSKWITLSSRAESSAGSKACLWDGRISGVPLAPGIYAVRVTPYSGGRAGAQKSLSVRILPQPSVTMTSLYPSVFHANGARSQRIAFRWTVMTDVKVQIVTQTGAPVRTLYEAKSKAAGSLTLYWNGRGDAGALVRAGYYRVRITCGGRVLLRTFRVAR